MGHADRFSIRQMVELTGLTEFTIRGWENRYLAFRPERSQTGRREYFKADVERAILLRELLKRGHKIGKVAKLNNKILKALFEGDEKVERENAQDDVPEQVSQAMELLALQKWTELKQLFREVLF